MSDRKYLDNETRQHLDAVSRAYRDARDQEGVSPPDTLDDAIRAAARRAVHAGPQPIGKNWLRRWTPPLAVAAVVVLSVSVVFVAVEERPELAPAPVQEITLARSADAPTTSHNASGPGVISAKEKTTLARDLAARSTPREPLRTQILDQTEAKGRVAIPPPEVQISRQTIKPVKKEERGAVEKDRAVQLAGGQPLASPAYSPRPAPVISAPAAPATPALPPAPFPASDAAVRNETRSDVHAGAPVAAAPQAKRLAENTALASAASSRDAIDAAPKPAIANTIPAPTAAAAAAAPAAQGAVARSSLSKQLAAAAPPHAETSIQLRDKTDVTAQAGHRALGKEELSPADARVQDIRPGPWLKRLMELREQNKLKELRAELVRFQNAHPNVVLPKVLTEVAESRE